MRYNYQLSDTKGVINLSSSEGLALLDVLLQFGQASFEEFLFRRGEFANRVDLLNAINLRL